MLYKVQSWESTKRDGSVLFSVREEHRTHKLVKLMETCTLMTTTQKEDESDPCFSGYGVFCFRQMIWQETLEGLQQHQGLLWWIRFKQSHNYAKISDDRGEGKIIEFYGFFSILLHC